MKKVVSCILCVAIITGMCIQGLALDSKESVRQARLRMIETYDMLCAKYNQDEERAMTELLELYPSLEIVDSSVTYFDGDGNEVKNARSTVNDINVEGDTLVYDSEWDDYVYFGYWEWKVQPNETFLSPYDVVGFYTQSDVEMYPLEYFVYGYDTAGKRQAYYNSDSDESSGYIVKGEDTSWGAAFWIDDRYVRSGRMVVPLDTIAGSNKKVMLKYCHSWSSTNITGIGGSIGVGSAGFDISWDTSVRHWESPVTSAGVRIP